MSAVQALVLGILQGLSEFLPISSSGHLVLLQKIFNVSEGSMSFDIILHMGTLISLCVVMRKRLFSYLREPFGKVPKMVALGTVPTVVIAFAFGSFFNALFETGISLGFGFLYTAVILYLAEKRASDGEAKRPQPADITPGDALIVGTAQGIAVTPAISRSGSTIAAGLMAGLSRPAAVEFAFLMSIPVTLLAVAQDLLKIIIAAMKSPTESAAASATAFGPLETFLGFAAAAAVGYFAAKYMLKAIQKIRLTWFSIYVGALGILILLDQLFFGVVFDRFFK